MKSSHLSKALAMCFVDSQRQSTETYLLNPNGSVGSVTSLCSIDGRVTIIMPTIIAVSQLVRMTTARGCGCSAMRGLGFVNKRILALCFR